MPEDIVLRQFSTRAGLVYLTQSHEPPHFHTVGRIGPRNTRVTGLSYTDALNTFQAWNRKLEAQEARAEADRAVDRAVELICAEHDRSLSKHGRFNSHHEAWAVMREEGFEMRKALDVLIRNMVGQINARIDGRMWQAVMADDLGALKTEAVQAGAMALKLVAFIDDVQHAGD